MMKNGSQEKRSITVTRDEKREKISIKRARKSTGLNRRTGEGKRGNSLKNSAKHRRRRRRRRGEGRKRRSNRSKRSENAKRKRRKSKRSGKRRKRPITRKAKQELAHQTKEPKQQRENGERTDED